MAKTPQLHLKQGIPMSYPNPPLSPYSGALMVQFALSPFYKFVALSLMVLYQLESFHLDNYNLIYSQNKNRGFDKILTAFPLETKHFSFYNHSSKPIQTNPTNTNQQYSSKLNPTQPQNSFTTKTKIILSIFEVFPNSNTNKRGLGFKSYLKFLSNFNTKVHPCFFFFYHFSLWFSWSNSQISSFKNPSSLPFSQKRKCLNERNVSQRSKYGLYVSYLQGPVWLSH